MELLTSDWADYELIDSGDGNRLERFGRYTVVRPDPQAIWKPITGEDVWSKADARFVQSSVKGERGNWVKNSGMPDKWSVQFNNICIQLRLTPFKHTGVFPEQAAHWQWLEEKITAQKSNLKNTHKSLQILNLFAYTGIASLICAANGAAVTHVDASKPAISWARENQLLSKLSEKQIRWIPDDAIKFIRREIKRGIRYDGIIMDPPVYGHGPDGETWDFMKDFPVLLNLCRQVLTDNPVFILINAYAVSASAIMLANVLNDLQLPGNTEYGELVLREKRRDRMLSTGIFARWSCI